MMGKALALPVKPLINPMIPIIKSGIQRAKPINDATNHSLHYIATITFVSMVSITPNRIPVISKISP